jgi:pSer/pThr/pTyr-binding forkhead associated (FHA) protein
MARTWTIGSGPDCDLVVKATSIAASHCRLTSDPEGFVLEDLGSTGGTYVNGRRMATPVRVTTGDVITLGRDIPMPWPPELTTPVSKVLRIGREPDNDFVVNLPTVSGYHARIVWESSSGQAWIEDLGSSNGTALGAMDRRIRRAIVTEADMIYLGNHPIPAASLLAQLAPQQARILRFQGDRMLIGRAPECDQVLDFPMISSRHARLIRSGGQTFIEDLGSSNGTYVNGRRIDRREPVRSGDVIGLGSYTIGLSVEPPSAGILPSPVTQGSGSGVTAAEMTLREHRSRAAEGGLSPTIEVRDRTRPKGRWPESEGTEARPIRSTEVLPAVRASMAEACSKAWSDFASQPWRSASLFVQAPAAALAIVLADRAAPGGGGADTALIPALVFWLALAAVWFGLSDAVFGSLPGETVRNLVPEPGGAARFLAQFVVLGALCLAQCLLAWALVGAGTSLKGLGLAALVLLILASTVGLSIGMAIILLAPRSAPAWAFLPLVMLLLWLLGGQTWPLPKMPAWAAVTANAVPSRWAFEGLLLLQVEVRPAAGDAGDDLAELFFPAATTRMGVRADMMALVAMLLGLVAAIAFIAEGPKPAS